MESLVKEDSKLDKKLEGLLDQFEREVEPYDRWSGISMFATPVGVIISIFIPMVIMQFVTQANPYITVSSSSTLYWIIGGILATMGLTKLSIFYVDHKKHEISRLKYKPIAGICMCDLSQLRSQMIKLEKARTAGDRIKYVKLVNYYKHQIGWQ
jgi:hypothetical protein